MNTHCDVGGRWLHVVERGGRGGVVGGGGSGRGRLLPVRGGRGVYRVEDGRRGGRRLARGRGRGGGGPGEDGCARLGLGNGHDVGLDLCWRLVLVDGRGLAPGTRASAGERSGGAVALLLRLFLRTEPFLVALFHGLEAVGRVCGEVLGLFHVGHGLVVLADGGRLVLPHLGDELGDVGLGAAGLGRAGARGRLQVLHLRGPVQDPRVRGARRAAVGAHLGGGHAVVAEARVVEERRLPGPGEVRLHDVDVVERAARRRERRDRRRGRVVHKRQRRGWQRAMRRRGDDDGGGSHARLASARRRRQRPRERDCHLLGRARRRGTGRRGRGRRREVQGRFLFKARLWRKARPVVARHPLRPRQRRHRRVRWIRASQRKDPASPGGRQRTCSQTKAQAVAQRRVAQLRHPRNNTYSAESVVQVIVAGQKAGASSGSSGRRRSESKGDIGGGAATGQKAIMGLVEVSTTREHRQWGKAEASSPRRIESPPLALLYPHPSNIFSPPISRLYTCNSQYRRMGPLAGSIHSKIGGQVLCPISPVRTSAGRTLRLKNFCTKSSQIHPSSPKSTPRHGVSGTKFPQRAAPPTSNPS